MDAEELKYWLALHHTPGIGVVCSQGLLANYKHPEALFKEQPAALSKLGLSAESIAFIRAPDWHSIEQDLAWQAKANCQIVPLHDPAYPALLKEIHDPPLLLYVCGKKTYLQYPQLAIVGSRRATKNGCRLAEAFANILATRGFAITSGLAFGIDYYSHIGAIAGAGKTIFVAGHGPDMIYPKEHRELAAKIILEDHGVMVSEFSPGTKPLPRNFPRRNRIISGLSVGVLVVEATIKSGSLITAKYALEQGREVFAIPGSLYNPLAKGCHSLIKKGAKLVEEAEDIIEDLSHLLALTKPAADTSIPVVQETEVLDADYQRLLVEMGYDPVALDTLVEATGFSVAILSNMLLILELKGMIESMPGGTYIRIG